MHAIDIAAEGSNSKPIRTADLSSYLELIGATVGAYDVVELIGKGGMAAVYMAHHRALGHSVAIKILHARHLTHPIMVKRFANEARAMASIRHPGVVQVHDIRRHVDGRPYIVMELLEGESLRARLKGGPLPEDEVITFSRQIASALDAAHARGMVHRDIKPDNIFLADDPELALGERAKVLDFGIAKLPEPHGANVTRTGMLIGTPEYMSPEQCQGSDAVDARADIYGLGMLMYRMAAGQLPFPSGNDGQILDRQIRERITPPRSVGAEISVELERVIMTCLAKNPAHRFESMAALGKRLGELEEHLEKTSVDASSVIRIEADDSERGSSVPVVLFGRSNPVRVVRVDDAPAHPVLAESVKPPRAVRARPATAATREIPHPVDSAAGADDELSDSEASGAEPTTDDGITDGDLTVPDPAVPMQQHRTGAVRAIATPLAVPRVVRSASGATSAVTASVGSTTSTGIPLPLPAEPSEPEHVLVPRPVLADRSSLIVRSHELVADAPDEVLDEVLDALPHATPVPASGGYPRVRAREDAREAAREPARAASPLNRRVPGLDDPGILAVGGVTGAQPAPGVESSGLHGVARPVAGEHPSFLMAETTLVSLGPSRAHRMGLAALIGLAAGGSAFWAVSALGWL